MQPIKTQVKSIIFTVLPTDSVPINLFFAWFRLADAIISEESYLFFGCSIMGAKNPHLHYKRVRIRRAKLPIETLLILLVIGCLYRSNDLRIVTINIIFVMPTYRNMWGWGLERVKPIDDYISNSQNYCLVVLTFILHRLT